MKPKGIKSYKNNQEIDLDKSMYELLKNNPIPNEQLGENLGLFLNSKNFSRILFMHHIYQKIVNIPGVIMDFGTRWGHNMALFSIFRGIYEPFNRHRKIIGFDTFSGFPSVHEKDGSSDLMLAGNASTSKNYKEFLSKILDIHEMQNPLSHIKKNEICEGDATQEIIKYLERNPETIISLAYFDFDIYEPTKKCLKIIKDRVIKGSVIGFDELNDHDSPGETLALMEVFGLNNIMLKRLPITSRTSYFIVD